MKIEDNKGHLKIKNIICQCRWISSLNQQNMADNRLLGN